MMHPKTPTVLVLASLALAARADLSSNTDSLSELEFSDVLADLDNSSDDLVAGDDELGLPWAPAAGDGVVVLIISGVQVWPGPDRRWSEASPR